jgi:hypothetical protein
MMIIIFFVVIFFFFVLLSQRVLKNDDEIETIEKKNGQYIYIFFFLLRNLFLSLSLFFVVSYISCTRYVYVKTSPFFVRFVLVTILDWDEYERNVMKYETQMKKRKFL